MHATHRLVGVPSGRRASLLQEAGAPPDVAATVVTTTVKTSHSHTLRSPGLGTTLQRNSEACSSKCGLLLLLLWLLHGCGAAFLQPAHMQHGPDSPFMLLVVHGVISIFSSVASLASSPLKLPYRHFVWASLAAILSLLRLVTAFSAEDPLLSRVASLLLGASVVSASAALLVLQLHVVSSTATKWRCLLLACCYASATLGQAAARLVMDYASVGVWLHPVAAATAFSLTAALCFFLQAPGSS